MRRSELDVLFVLLSIAVALSIGGCQQRPAAPPALGAGPLPPAAATAEPNAPTISPAPPVSPAPPAISPEPPAISPTPPTIAPEPIPDTAKPVARISFEKTVHDFGELGVGEKGECLFKFKNTGNAPLIINKIQSGCGCTVPSLSKRQYKPGEEGSIKVVYKGQTVPGPMVKSIGVPTNDPNKAKVKLILKAKVAYLVEVTPAKLELSFDKENAGVTEIQLKSKDGKPFSIKGFASDNRAFQTDFDPNTMASRFVLQPKVDMEKLRKSRRGTMKIRLDHPRCKLVTVRYEVPPQFQAQPSRIWLRNVEAGKPQIKEIRVTSVNKKPFEIQSVSSRRGYVKLTSQEPAGGSVRVKVQITPPPKKNKQAIFNDTLHIKITKDESINIPCYGSYGRRASRNRGARAQAR